MSLEIGYDVSVPEGECNDENCPFHGKLKLRGRSLDGEVASDAMDKTVIVERQYEVEVPKYERKERRKSRIPTHLPPCLDAEKGDKVKIAECRPLSKTKSFTVIEVE